MTTQPVWDGSTVTSIDLDLDVVRDVDGVVRVEDEDEFAAHQVELGYPPDVVRAAEQTCLQVLADVRDARPPFDGSHLPWLELLRGTVRA